MTAKTPEKKPDEMPEPARWSDSASESRTAEQAIGVAFRRVRAATEPSDTAVASVGRRLNAEEQPTRARMLWRLAIAAALIMATGGVVGAALHRWRRADAVVPESAAPVAEAQPAARPRHRRRHSVSGVAEPAASAESADVEDLPDVPPSEVPAPVVPALEPPAPAVVTPAPASVAPIATQARPPSRGHRAAAATPAAESVGAAIIADAFRDLRSRGDAAAALRSLDEYDRRFPDGVLRAESRVARVEALLLLDRRAEALQLLEAVGPGGALTRDVRVTRGELLLERDRCTDATRDFDGVLAARDGDPAGGRALYGRASCRLRGGDVPGARADLTRYLSLHADGPSAAAARRALVALP